MSGPPPTLLTDGDPRHGVVRFSRELAAEVATQVGSRQASAAVHLHFADRAWGATPAQAAERALQRSAGRRLTLTLHDVPQASDGPERLGRRTAAYRRVIDAGAGLVCNSHHEAALLRETGMLADHHPEPAVIPLPVMVPALDGPPPAIRREVALLGFVYPGKGHAEAIVAASRLEDPPAVRALGGPAPGHAGDLAHLRRLARRRGVEFSVTGWLSERELSDAGRAAAIPLAAHAHLSASGSINSWIAIGRRPLVADSRYAREIDALRPGTIDRYGQGTLPGALARALSHRGRTWRAPGTASGPHLAEVAERYLAWWAER